MTVRKFHLKQIHRRILGYIGRGDKPVHIMKFTGLKQANLYKKLDLLSRHGYISKKKIGNVILMELQPLGSKELSIHSMGIQKVERIRLHDVWISCPILRKPKGWDYDFVEKILEEKSLDYTKHHPNNWKGLYFDYASVKVRVTPNKVLINPPTIEISLEDSPDHAKNEIMKILDSTIPRIENLFKIALNKPRKASMTVSSQHIAFVENEMAKYFINAGIDLRVYDSNAKLRIIVDRSHGYNELEAVNKAHAEEDAGKLKDLIGDVVTGEFDHRDLQEKLYSTADLVHKIAENQDHHERNIQTHIDAIKMMADVIQRLDDRFGDKLVAQNEQQQFYKEDLSGLRRMGEGFNV